MPLGNRMTLLDQTPHEEESEEYFTPPQSPDCNEDGRLESNQEDQYSHKKMLQIGQLNIVKDLKEKFNYEIIYLILTNNA